MSSSPMPTGRSPRRWRSACWCCWSGPLLSSSASRPKAWSAADARPRPLRLRHAGLRLRLPLPADRAGDRLLVQRIAHGHGVGGLLDPMVERAVRQRGDALRRLAVAPHRPGERHGGGGYRPGGGLRAGARAVLLRPHPVRQPGHRPHGDARGGDGHLHAAAVRRFRAPVRRARSRLPHHRHRPHHLLDLLRRHRGAGAARRFRPFARGGGDGSRRHALGDLPHGDVTADRAGGRLGLAARLHPVARRPDPDPVRRRRAVADPADARLFQRAAGRRSADQRACHHHRCDRRVRTNFLRLADAPQGLGYPLGVVQKWNNPRRKPAMIDRRALLRQSGAVVATLGAASIFDPLRALADTVKLPFDNGERPLVKYPQKRPMIGMTSRPPQLETPFSVFTDGPITPNNAFFVRYHLAGIPLEIDPDTFTVEVKGKVDKPLKLSLAELKRMPSVEIVAVNQCSGNSRGFFNPRVAGGQIANGAMGNARWKGVPLKTVLDKAGVQANAKQVVFGGMDGPVSDKTPDFAKAL